MLMCEFLTAEQENHPLRVHPRISATTGFCPVASGLKRARFVVGTGKRGNRSSRQHPMKPAAKKPQRCAIYTRVSTDNGLEQEFNSLHAQREAAQAYVRSQATRAGN